MEYNLNDVMVERYNKTVYFDNGRTIKLFKEHYSKAQILNEALIHARIEEDTDLQIPKLQEIAKINDRWAIVLDHIYGRSLQNMMDDHPENMDELLRLFVDIQKEVLSRSVPMLGRIKEKFRRKLTSTDLIDNGTKYELLQRLEGMQNKFCLCHGDFNPSNVIIDDNGDWHVIDWAHATQGNEEADAARTYLLFCMDNKIELGAKYLDVFSEKLGINKIEILRWVPLVAATQYTKGREEEKTFLEKWFNVVEYM